MMEKRLIYLIIVEEFNDDDGHYFVATSPNIPGMVTQGDSLADVAYWAEDAIGTMLEDQHEYPAPQDPTKWQLNPHQKLIYVTVDMKKLLEASSKTIRRTITVPKYLNDLAKENHINVSGLTTKALKSKLGI
ncbi:type II toxin-antitoxin system HicB family antitoxin [Lentilactobacillus parakefiri]|uniref:HicB family protein n=2 Tax=Lentilactobacillus parakefiri TaxID=152332 RepID=A0A269XYK5_9LACO|nr:type II toxin-antitoxin system HicB family antitoxin [Lentilactobacillus parakefiri]PAK77516.1 HicB family protein [Lentilactobacillus parakefiri]PAK99810.1 HicB family protein [Lentilactobacillus parakefiri]